MKNKSIKLTLDDLRNIVSKVIIESKENIKHEFNDSLDAQIDKYLSGYEKEAKSFKNEGHDIRTLTRRLLEANVDQQTVDTKDDKGSLDDIDVQSFVSDVVRLIDNYDSLLEVRATILRRGANYLSEVYDSDVLDAYENILQEEYGMKLKDGKTDPSEEVPRPNSAEAVLSAEAGGIS